ncbi:MAG: DNA topoisomerase [candidate division Zixibacteria bacterium RBG-1]|nr:MAG: DNA topoisomerase [candidate division Zixibacteria bacterium RBG-1]
MKRKQNKMAKNLVIVESPTKTKSLSKFLGKEFIIEASVGHVKDLPQKKLGVDVKKNFTPEYVTIKGKEKVLATLKKAAQKVKQVYLAPDPDREGEAIAFHVAEEIKKINPHIARASFNEITKEAVLKGIKQAGKIDMDKVQAQQARRILDRLVGYQVSPILWKTVYRGLSAGRVQSVALRLICEREEQVLNFVPREYWSIQAKLETAQKENFLAGLFKIEGKDFEIKNETEVKKLTEDIKTKKFVVSEVKTETKNRYPYPPYTTSTLQQDAARRLYFSPQKTMIVAQQLYEGVELEQGEVVGLITYMRTDAVRIADEALKAVRKFISVAYSEKYLPEKPNFYKSKKTAQQAHEAIRPTYVEYTPEKVRRFLTKDQYRLYELIWNRFVACQMTAAVYDATSVDIEAEKYLFRANSSILKFDGFLKIYQDLKEENGNGNGDAEPETKLPKLKNGVLLKLLELIPEQHFTKPPARFSEASLIKELEACGIGRPSTYAIIVSTIKGRKYVVNEKRRLYPTDLGKTVNKILVENFPDIFEVGFTATMEEELDKVEEGEMKWVQVLKDFYQPFSATLEKVQAKEKKIKKQQEEKTDEICEKCGSAMIIKWGRNGRFLACSNYPACKNTKNVNHKEEQELVNGEKCNLCGSPMVVKSGRFGRFLACSNYPKCKNTKSITLKIPCPEKGCGGEITEKRSKKGRVFYGCSRYPKCKFASWDKPVSVKCPQCGANFMVEKSNKTKGEFLKCLSCKFETEPKLEAVS